MGKRTRRGDLALFAKKLLMLALPPALFFSLSSYVLVVAGEMVPVGKLIDAQRQNDTLVLYGPAYVYPDKYYKLESVLAGRPDVIALGSSRVMQFRSKFFKPGTVFFNAGGAAGSIRHVRRFLARIPAAGQPKVLLLGLDPYWFNARYDHGAEDDIDEQLSSPSSAAKAYRASYRVYADYFKRKFTMKELLEKKTSAVFGLNAIINGNGFRNDGSYTFAKDPDNPDDADGRTTFTNVFDRIDRGVNRFEYNKEFSPDAVKELRELLGECAARKIHVVGFLPPFAHVVYEKMRAMGERYQYLFDLPAVFAKLFESSGFAFFDFSDLASTGASDEGTTDGFHASEKAYLRLFLMMASRDPVLRRYAGDPDYLRTRLRQSASPRTVFANNEF